MCPETDPLPLARKHSSCLFPVRADHQLLNSACVSSIGFPLPRFWGRERGEAGLRRLCQGPHCWLQPGWGWPSEVFYLFGGSRIPVFFPFPVELVFNPSITPPPRHTQAHTLSHAHAFTPFCLIREDFWVCDKDIIRISLLTRLTEQQQLIKC